MDLIEYKPSDDGPQPFCGHPHCSAWRTLDGASVCGGRVAHMLKHAQGLVVNAADVVEGAQDDDAAPSVGWVAEALVSYEVDALRRALAGLAEEPWKRKVQTR